MQTAQILRVELGERGYPIEIASDILPQLSAVSESAREVGRRMVVVTDDNVRAAAREVFDRAFPGTPVISVPPGETSKSFSMLERVCDFLASERIDRVGLLVAVGGGVVGDLGGFAAASYLRGIEFWQVPTSLLAMVDSAVGGKTGINLVAGKNLVGAFHQPRAVFCGMELLKTLPAREFAAGMAEVIKTGLLGDVAMFEAIEAAPVTGASDERLAGIVRRCCEIKIGFVKADERETAGSGGRALLNLGHTFAHAIEAVAGYGEYLHGEAVAVGLVAAAHLSTRLNLIPTADAERVRVVVDANRLPTRLRGALSCENLMQAMRRDKKVREGRLRFVVLEALGQAVTRDDVEATLIEEIWRDLGAA